MSDTSQGPGWWLASDGKWYPPDLWTGPPTAGPTTQTGAPGVSPASGPTSVPTNPASANPTTPFGTMHDPGQSSALIGAPYGGGYPPQQYGQYPPYGAVPVKQNNGLAIAALVCACLGWLLFVPALLAIIFGFVARSQIRQSNGLQRGDGLAIAGIVVGFAWVALFVVIFAFGANTSSTGVVGFHHALAVAGIHT